MYYGIVTIEHPVLTPEEKERRYQKLIDCVIRETKKSIERGTIK